MPNGIKCRAAALRNQPYCYFHTRAHRLTSARGRPSKQPLEVPLLEDRSTIQLTLTQILDGLASKRIDSKKAGLLLYGLQIASQNVRGDTPNLSGDTVQFAFRTKGGRDLAPEKFTCDPPEDCEICKGRNKCVHYRLVARLSGDPDPGDEPGGDAPGNPLLGDGR